MTTQIGTGDAEDPVYPETVGLVGHIETEVGRTAMDIAAEALDRSGKIAIIEGSTWSQIQKEEKKGIERKIKNIQISRWCQEFAVNGL